MTTRSNDGRLKEAFMRVLSLSEAEVTDDLAYASIRQWDSVAHMALVAVIEDSFDIMLETEDIIAMRTVAETRMILGKYAIEFDAPAA